MCDIVPRLSNVANCYKFWKKKYKALLEIVNLHVSWWYKAHNPIYGSIRYLS